MLDVAVIGAGPAGLCAAAALSRCRPTPLRVEVFDHVSKFETCGAGIAMRTNGFAALEAIDSAMCHKIAKMTAYVPTTVMHSLDGKELGRQSSKDKGKTKYGVSSMALLGWSELRNGVAEHVAADSIHLSKRFSHLQQFDDHVQLTFADGASVDAKIAVGADGCFSRIRQHILTDGLPTFTDTVVWRARLTGTSLPQGQIQFFAKGDMNAVCYPIADDQHIWTVSASSSRLKEVGLDVRAGPSKAHHPTEGQGSHASELSQTDGNGDTASVHSNGTDLSASERCRRVWGDNAQLIHDLIDATDESTVLEHNMHVRHPDSLAQGFWGKGRVTLIGDAAHAMRPASGQGVSQAFEDAVHLAHAIQQGGPTGASLRAYEAKRIPRVREVMAAEMASGQKAYTSKSDDLGSNLATYKHAQARWQGTDNGAYEAWLLNESFEPLANGH